MDKKDIKSMNLGELKKDMEELGEKAFRATQVYEWIHVKLVQSFDEMTNISEKLKEKLREKYNFTTLEIVDKQVSAQDGTAKYLFRLQDGNLIESVLMKYKHGNSVCISSQAGCRMGCKFCASTIAGLKRNLFPSEMLEQIYRIQRESGERVSNVVVMGTGEPFDNYDNLIRFLKLLTDEKGLHISARNITVSTCGIVPKIREFAEENMQVTLAISLHAPNNEKRKRMMPIANKYSIEELLDACRYFFEKTGRRITFEYSLADGVNDSEQDAAELISLVKGMNCHVNLIPINPVEELEFEGSAKKVAEKFKNKLEKSRINVTIRREMGRDIDGACGQLRRKFDGAVREEGTKEC
ncbi:MAG: 23S rRNA (adenine(2503)-C(2))-methyltransferase RlmN [Lachnospiraceae bacterium]|nr:23S rRNA (adenine(2503)-C(2))-methyltransferase RlmN [Lachnospiraceae bacterium]